MKIVQFEDGSYGLRKWKFPCFRVYFNFLHYRMDGVVDEWRFKGGNRFFHQCTCETIEEVFKVIEDIKSVEKKPKSELKIIYSQKV